MTPHLPMALASSISRPNHNPDFQSLGAATFLRIVGVTTSFRRLSSRLVSADGESWESPPRLPELDFTGEGLSGRAPFRPALEYIDVIQCHSIWSPHSQVESLTHRILTEIRFRNFGGGASELTNCESCLDAK